MISHTSLLAHGSNRARCPRRAALIADIRRIYDNYEFDTEILAASVRTINHVREAALIGADVATVPPATLKALVKHPLTDKGLEQFMADWQKTGQTIS